MRFIFAMAMGVALFWRMAGATEGITVGTQPLAIPTGTVSAVMARDGLLKNRLQDMGLTIRFQPFAKGHDINQAMIAGKVSMGFGGDMPTLEMAARHPIVVPAMVKMAFASLVGRETMTVRDLKGRRVANAPNSSAHQVLLAALHHAGLEEKDVTLVNLDVNQMVPALVAGQVEAFVAWEPTPSMALAHHPDFFVMHRGLTFSYFYGTRAFAEKNPEAFRTILASLARALYWMRDKPANLELACQWNLEDAASFSKENNPVSLSLCLTLTRQDLLQPAPLGQIPASNLQEDGDIAAKFRFLQTVGKIAKDASLAHSLQSFDRHILEEIWSQPEIHQIHRLAVADRATGVPW